MFKRKVDVVYLNPPTTAGKRRRDFRTDSNVIESAELLHTLGIEAIAVHEGIIVTSHDMQRFTDMLREVVVMKEMLGDTMED